MNRRLAYSPREAYLAKRLVKRMTEVLSLSDLRAIVRYWKTGVETETLLTADQKLASDAECVRLFKRLGVR